MEAAESFGPVYDTNKVKKPEVILKNEKKERKSRSFQSIEPDKNNNNFMHENFANMKKLPPKSRKSNSDLMSFDTLSDKSSFSSKKNIKNAQVFEPSGEEFALLKKFSEPIKMEAKRVKKFQPSNAILRTTSSEKLKNGEDFRNIFVREKYVENQILMGSIQSSSKTNFMDEQMERLDRIKSLGKTKQKKHRSKSKSRIATNLRSGSDSSFSVSFDSSK
jgi:hypothetical protein